MSLKYAGGIKFETSEVNNSTRNQSLFQPEFDTKTLLIKGLPTEQWKGSPVTVKRQVKFMSQGSAGG